MITQELVHELVSYNKNTGIMKWKYRDIKFFLHTKNPQRMWKVWNAKFAGKEIGSWRKPGYLETAIFNYKTQVHRLIWFYVYGIWPDHIDHIDHDGLNNKLDNLRNVNHAVNMKNMKQHVTNKSGVTGVHRHSQHDTWIVQIWDKNKIKHIGSFKNFEDAVQARKQAEIQYGYHENHGSSEKG